MLLVITTTAVFELAAAGVVAPAAVAASAAAVTEAGAGVAVGGSTNKDTKPCYSIRLQPVPDMVVVALALESPEWRRHSVRSKKNG